MSTSKHYDVIIAGAGCAGLGLAWELTSRFNERLPQTDSAIFENESSFPKRGRSFKRYNPPRILIVDKSFEPNEEKTWCYWDDVNLPDIPINRHYWSKLKFGSPNSEVILKLHQHRYYCIRSEDYTGQLVKFLSKVDNIDFIEANILCLEGGAAEAKVFTSKGVYSADMMFQSVFKNPRLEQRSDSLLQKSGRYKLLQHFVGIEIKSNLPVFDNNTATLMDFDVSQHGATAFMYVLPFNKSHALVEFTLFSEELLKEKSYLTEIEKYIQRKFGLSNNQYEVIRTEKGAIPMHDEAFQLTYDQRIYSIGVASGITKPTTGYTFSRIHRMNKKIADIFEQDSEMRLELLNKLENPSEHRFRFYDLLLLSILQSYPEKSTTIFKALFIRNSGDSILQFLDEKSDVLQEIFLFLSLPKIPFLKALWQNKNAIFH